MSTTTQLFCTLCIEPLEPRAETCPLCGGSEHFSVTDMLKIVKGIMEDTNDGTN